MGKSYTEFKPIYFEKSGKLSKKYIGIKVNGVKNLNIVRYVIYGLLIICGILIKKLNFI